MRLKSVRRPALLTAAAVSLAVGVLVPGSSATAAPTKGKPSAAPTTQCTSIVANEHTLERTPVDVDPVGLSVGDGGTFVNDFRKDDGTLVAVTHGSIKILYQRPEDGHFFGRYQERIDFANGGTVITSGVADDTAMLTGGKSYISLTGVGGRYRGYYGVREWDFLSRVDTLATFTLCHG